MLADKNGDVVITMSVSDGSQTTNASFTLHVTAVNDAPSFALASSSLAISANAGLQTTTGFATGISAGPSNEASQHLVFQLTPSTTSGNLAFAVPPAIDPATGTLTYQVAANTMGQATVTAVLVDDGSNVAPNVNSSIVRTFTIDVSADRWHNYVRPRDVDASGDIVPRDALLVINEINQRTISASDGRLPTPSAGTHAPPYFDVSNDGFLTSIDALLIINFLNGFGGEGETAVEGLPPSASAEIPPMKRNELELTFAADEVFGESTENLWLDANIEESSDTPVGDTSARCDEAPAKIWEEVDWLDSIRMR